MLSHKWRLLTRIIYTSIAFLTDNGDKRLFRRIGIYSFLCALLRYYKIELFFYLKMAHKNGNTSQGAGNYLSVSYSSLL